MKSNATCSAISICTSACSVIVHTMLFVCVFIIVFGCFVAVNILFDVEKNKQKYGCRAYVWWQWQYQYIQKVCIVHETMVHQPPPWLRNEWTCTKSHEWRAGQASHIYTRMACDFEIFNISNSNKYDKLKINLLVLRVFEYNGRS